ncbi:hypothetical protein KXR83_15410 [Williamsia muralis]|uniref:hypothetical protein n=1 Tax=Williamsia marianensis TaxID=85044 RepID=UPI003F1563BD
MTSERESPEREDLDVAQAADAPSDRRNPLRRKWLWVLIAVVLVAVVGIVATVLVTSPDSDTDSPAATPSARPQNPYEQSRSLGVTLTLQAYTDALREGDAESALAQLDASATAALRERTGASAAGLPALPLSAFEFRLSASRDFERLVPAELQERLDTQGSSDSWVAPVQLRYAYEGIDSIPVVLDLPMVMAQYPEGWKMVADAGPLFGQPAPAGQVWEFPSPSATPVATAPGESLVLTNGSDTGFTARLEELLPAATWAVTQFWGAKWPQGAGIVAAPTDDEFRSLTGAATADAQAAAAVSIFAGVDPAGPTALGQRVVFSPQATQLDPNALAVVLRHELFHVAARTVTAQAAPVWVTEGVAEYVGRRGTYTRLADAAPTLAGQVAAGELPADLPSDANFSPGSPDAALSYQSAWSVAAFIADKFGDDKLKRFYVALAGADQPTDPELVIKSQDTASNIVLGISREELVDQWRGWLTASP